MLLVIAILLARHAAAAQSKCTVGGTVKQLRAALADSRCSLILIGSDYVVTDSDRQQGAVHVSRNVTLMGQPGQPEPVLDLDFANSVIELCSTCVFTLRNITVKNERRGSGLAYDAFFGMPGSRISSEGVRRLRLACTSPPVAAAVLAGTPRSSLLAGRTQQRTQVVSAEFRGKVYPASLLLEDVAVDVPLAPQEGGGAAGGYHLVSRGDVRLCEQEVPQACLAKKSADACVIGMIDDLTAAAAAAAEGAAPQAPRPSTTAVFVAVPIAVAGLAAAAAVALLLHLRHRRRRRQLGGFCCDQQSQLQQLPSTCGRGSSSSGSSNGGGSEKGPCSKSLTTQKSLRVSSLPQVLTDANSWDVSCCISSPLLGALEDPQIELGPLLGTGSYGRVYRGTLNDTLEVAVKVIDHGADALEAVENEMKMIFSFDHPNVVRALYAVTYTHGSGCGAGAGSCCNGSSNGDSRSLCKPGLMALARPDSSDMGCSLSSALRSSSKGLGVHAAASGSLGGCSGSLIGVSHICDEAAAAAAAAAAAVGASPAGAEPAHGPQSAEVPVAAGSSELVLPAVGGATGCGCSSGGSDTMSAGCEVRCSSSRGWGRSSSLGPARAETWLVQEYCTEGTLTAFMARTGPVSLADEPAVLQLLLLLRDTAQGLGALHAHNVVHGDLTGTNVLVTEVATPAAGDAAAVAGVDSRVVPAAGPPAFTAGTKLTAKVADLGLARVVDQHRTHRTTGNLGTLNHSAPELLQSGRMSPACDVYAFGIMMWELWTGQQAFKKLQLGQFFETVVLRNLRPMIPPGMPADYQLLMEHCWATNPADRPNTDRLLEFLAYMISGRQASMEAARPSNTAFRTSSAPLPALLFKPLPEKPRWGRLQHAFGFGGSGGGGCSSAEDTSAHGGGVSGSDADSSARGGNAGFGAGGGGRRTRRNSGGLGFGLFGMRDPPAGDEETGQAAAAGAAGVGVGGDGDGHPISHRQWRHMLMRRSIGGPPQQQHAGGPAASGDAAAGGGEADRLRRSSLGERFARRSLDTRVRRRSLETTAEHHTQHFGIDLEQPHLEPHLQPAQAQPRHQHHRRQQQQQQQQQSMWMQGRPSLDVAGVESQRELSVTGRESSWFQSIREPSASRGASPWFV